jgi:hypothetical protein
LTKNRTQGRFYTPLWPADPLPGGMQEFLIKQEVKRTDRDRLFAAIRMKTVHHQIFQLQVYQPFITLPQFEHLLIQSEEIIFFKVHFSPSIKIQAGATFEMANINGPGVIQHIWLCPTAHWRFCILRIYWDDQKQPSVECPIGDFFASGWGKYAQLSSLAVCVNPGSAFNCYWPMPFRKKARVTMENHSQPI